MLMQKCILSNVYEFKIFFLFISVFFLHLQKIDKTLEMSPTRKLSNNVFQNVFQKVIFSLCIITYAPTHLIKTTLLLLPLSLQ